MKENYEFQLSEVLKISKSGDFEETATITIEPPSMQSHNEVSDFEQLFMGSLISAGNLFKSGKDEEDPEDEKSALQSLKDHTPSASEIRMMITLSQEVKLTKLFQAFKNVACKTAFVDEGLKMKSSHFEKISRDDSIRMLCEYASFFTFPSLLGGELEKTNGSTPLVT